MGRSRTRSVGRSDSVPSSWADVNGIRGRYSAKTPPGGEPLNPPELHSALKTFRTLATSGNRGDPGDGAILTLSLRATRGGQAVRFRRPGLRKFQNPKERDVISGLKLKVTSKEIQSHCTQRATYHRKRSAEKLAELPKIKEAMETIKSGGKATTVSNMGKSAANYHVDPDSVVEDLEKDVRDHDNKALVFDFFTGHLFDEDYTLEEGDLIRLEILKRY